MSAKVERRHKELAVQLTRDIAAVDSGLTEEDRLRRALTLTADALASVEHDSWESGYRAGYGNCSLECALDAESSIAGPTEEAVKITTAKVEQRHRELAALARYPDPGYRDSKSLATAWASGIYKDFGADERCLNSIAQAIAAAEQRGGELERAAVVKFLRGFNAATAAVVPFLEAGKHVEER